LFGILINVIVPKTYTYGKLMIFEFVSTQLAFFFQSTLIEEHYMDDMRAYLEHLKSGMAV